MLIVNATPVLSDLISDLTSDDGVIVGNGPAVSVGDTVQLPEPLPLPEPEPDPLPEEEVSFLQASKIIGTDAAPIKNCFRNFFLVCSIAIFLDNVKIQLFLPLIKYYR
jgi:hypothetical protein